MKRVRIASFTQLDSATWKREIHRLTGIDYGGVLP